MEDEIFEKKDNITEEETENLSSLDKAKINLREALNWLLMLVIVALASYIITNYVIIKAVIPTGSMRNTIMDNDKVIGWRLLTHIDRGDIVIFPALEYVGDNVDQLYVKRVIGLPGETVEIHDQAVYINGVKLKEDYLPDEMRDEDFGPYNVPEGRYFLLGDNRNCSEDARYWRLDKYVKRKDIKAKVIFKYNPSFEWFKNPEY